ncbi:MAG: hypothetical protein A2V70_20665 [Planctomycetes bacterium RBG_13_63_9]|nr:MAG: hypothetical protein A2V70_20665 [Planctomycetes bacterium RBG_13_63_9]
MLVRDCPVELADGLWMLGSAAYPLYLVQGERVEGEREVAIIEGGMGAMGRLLCEQMQQLEIANESVRQVVITHAHPDHVMAVPLFREVFPGAEVLASAAAAATLGAEKAIALFCKLDDALTGSLIQAGVVDEADRRGPLAENRIAVDRVIGEGDTVAVEGMNFEVLETPGHSACSLSFHEPKRRMLIISDASGYYLAEHGLWWPNYFSDYAEYVGSMRRLAGLGAEILCLSHNAVVQGAEDVESYFEGAISATEAYHRRILDETEAGKSVREIAEQLGSEAFEKTQLLPLDFFQKNCGVMVKLSLKHEGISPDQ